MANKTSYTEYNGSVFADGIARKVTFYTFLNPGSQMPTRATRVCEHLPNDSYQPGVYGLLLLFEKPANGAYV